MTLYIKPGCSWCVEAEDWLAARGLDVTVVDVFENPEAFARMRSISGQTLAPTLEMPDGAVLADFDVGQLQRFLQQRGIA
jgi:glutaredoxin 3